MRRACHNAITNAIPKLMEPIYQLNVICSYKAINVIKHLLLNKNPQQQQQQRRGEIDTVTPIPGTPLFSIKGYLPVIDSIGILTDIKLNTQGQAIGSLKFNHWEIVPDELSEEFIIKTRKKKVYKEMYRSMSETTIVIKTPVLITIIIIKCIYIYVYIIVV